MMYATQGAAITRGGILPAVPALAMAQRGRLMFPGCDCNAGRLAQKKVLGLAVADWLVIGAGGLVLWGVLKK